MSKNIIRFIYIFLILSICGCAPFKKIFVYPDLEYQVKENIKLPVFKNFGVAVISPNNDTIIFSAKFNDNTSCLFKINFDGTNLAHLTSGVTYDYDPAFSPNGKKIVYCHYSTDGEAGNIYVMNLDGSDKLCLTSGKEHDFEPIWSPDGNRMYFLRSPIFTHYSPIARPAWHEVDIYAINPDGTNLTKITQEKSYRMHTLSINENGDKLMVCGWDKDSHGESTQIIPIKNSKDKQIMYPNLEKYRKKTRFGLKKIQYKQIRNQIFSPKGKNVMFTWSYFEELYVANLETNSVSSILKFDKNSNNTYIYQGIYNPRFSNDGQYIIFNTFKKIKVKKYGFTWWSDPKKFSYEDTEYEPLLCVINQDGSQFRNITLNREKTRP